MIFARFCSLSLVALVWSAGAVRAQPSEPHDGPDPAARHLEVTLGHLDLAPLREVLDELLARHEVETSYRAAQGIELREVVRVREDATRLGYVWVDRRGDAELTVFIADRTAGRILVRSVALETGTVDEIARETAGHIIEATVEALLAGTPIGRPRDEVQRELGVEEVTPPPIADAPPADAQDAPTPEPESPAPQLGLGVAYGVRGVADDAVAHGPELHLELRSREQVRFGGRIGASFYLPTRWDGAIAGADLVGGAAWLDGLLDIQLAPSVYMALAVGVGVDLHFVTPRITAEPTLLTREPFVTLAVHLRGTLGLLIDPPDVPIAIRLDYWFAVDPTDLRFVVQTVEGPQPAVDPWLFQPAGRLSLLWQP